MAIRDVAIVGRNNKYGLTRDAEILRQGLASIGVGAVVFDMRRRSWLDRLRGKRVADLIVHLERVHPAWLAGASAPHSYSKPGTLPEGATSAGYGESTASLQKRDTRRSCFRGWA